MTTPILVIGRSGQVAQELMKVAWPADYLVETRGRDTLDVSDHRAIRRAVAEKQWAAVINAAAFTAVDKAEEERDLAFAVNASAPSHLAEACAGAGIPLVHISTDYVFDGTKTSPYVETDHVRPLSIYGLSKEAGEAAIRERHPMHVILRTSWIFSAAGQNFVKTMLRLGRERPALSIVVDQFGRPTAAADIASAIAKIVRAIGDGKYDGFGTFHFAGAGATTWHAFAKEIFEQANLRGLTSLPELSMIATADYPTPARRPVNSVLDTARIEAVYGITPRPWLIGLRDVLDTLIGIPAGAAR
jgi:dTDP-4-dehydrorhamnose reductase